MQQQQKRVHLDVGDTLNIFLESLPGAGFGWSVAYSPNCLQNHGQKSTPRNTLVGGPTVVQWSWKAVSTCLGITPLVLQYGRSWDPTTFVYYTLFVTVKNGKQMPKVVRVRGPSGTALVNQSQGK